MNKAIGLALLVGGIILAVMGYQASHSVSSEVSKAFTGTATDKATGMLIGGIAAAIAGGVLLGRRPF